MKTAISSAIATAAIALAIPAQAANASQEPKYLLQNTAQAANREDLLWWLPADTESVVAAQGPFAFPVPSGNEDNEGKDSNQDWGKRKVSQSEIHLQFEQLPLELFYSRSLDLAKSLQGSTVAFAMQGSRHFRDPLAGLEVMDFEGCSIVVFDESFGDRGKNLIQTLTKKATRTETIAGIGVLAFHQKYEEAEWDSFLALPQPNVFLAANNLPYLREVLERMEQKKNLRALPEQLPEWRFLDSAVRFWGLRHYDRTQAKQDPTSPFSEERTFGPSDQKAIGILFALDPNNQTKAVMTYFSGDKAVAENAVKVGTASEEAEIASLGGHEVVTRDGGKTLVDENPEEGVKYEVRLRIPAPGVLERTYTLDRTGTLSYFMLHMEVGLGRGMYF